MNFRLKTITHLGEKIGYIVRMKVLFPIRNERSLAVRKKAGMTLRSSTRHLQRDTSSMIGKWNRKDCRMRSVYALWLVEAEGNSDGLITNDPAIVHSLRLAQKPVAVVLVASHGGVGIFRQWIKWLLHLRQDVFENSIRHIADEQIPLRVFIRQQRVPSHTSWFQWLCG